MVAREQTSTIVRARGGCRRAFARLWQANEGKVRAQVARMLPSGVVDDVVQDVAVAALDGIASYRAESDFASWLLAIARHRAASALHRLRRQRARVDEGESVDRMLASDAGDRQRGDRHHVWQLLRRLPRAYRLPVWLRFVNGCSAPEIAERLGTTQGTVRVALCRALSRLRGLAGESRDRES